MAVSLFFLYGRVTFFLYGRVAFFPVRPCHFFYSTAVLVVLVAKLWFVLKLKPFFEDDRLGNLHVTLTTSNNGLAVIGCACSLAISAIGVLSLAIRTFHIVTDGIVLFSLVSIIAIVTPTGLGTWAAVRGDTTIADVDEDEENADD